MTFCGGINEDGERKSKKVINPYPANVENMVSS